MTDDLRTPFELAAAELRVQKLDPLEIEAVLRRRGRYSIAPAALSTISR